MKTNWHGKRAALTGATAFIGSILADMLVERGAHVRAACRQSSIRLPKHASDIEWIEGDLEDVGVCTELLKDTDMLFHLASHRKNVAYHREHKDEVITRNTAMTDALIAAMGNRSNLPVVFFSSALVTQKERAQDDGYLLAKLACEQCWQRIASPLLILRPVNVYGPPEPIREDGTVIPALIARAAAATDTLSVWGSGTQQRSFVCAQDLCAATLMLVEANVHGIIPVCPPEHVTIAELATMVRDMVNPSLHIAFDTTKPEGPPSLINLPLPPELQSFAWTPLEQGIKRTVDFWRHSAVG